MDHGEQEGFMASRSASPGSTHTMDTIFVGSDLRALASSMMDIVFAGSGLPPDVVGFGSALASHMVGIIPVGSDLRRPGLRLVAARRLVAAVVAGARAGGGGE